jgi:hypothetical protein
MKEIIEENYSMPKYHIQQLGEYKVEALPVGFWRSLLFLLNLNFPYFVGDKISLRIKLSKNKTITNKLNSTIRIGGIYPNAFDKKVEFQEIEIPILSGPGLELVKSVLFAPKEISSKSGEISIYVRKTFGDGSENKFVIFSADVKHDENFIWFVVIPIVAGFLSAIVGGIVGVLISR